MGCDAGRPGYAVQSQSLISDCNLGFGKYFNYMYGIYYLSTI